MGYALDLCRLAAECLSAAFEASKLSFSAALAFGALLAIAFWVFCGFTMRLVNKKFYLALAHHIICALAGVMTVILIILFFCCGYLKVAADKRIEAWRRAVVRDNTWSDDVFAKLYRAVKAQGRENFSAYPPPEAGGVTVPDGHPATRSYISSTWGSACVEHFRNAHPFLTVILPVSEKSAGEAANADYTKFRNVRGPTVPYEFLPNAARVASDRILEQAKSKTTRLIYLGRIAIVLGVILVQGIAYGVAASSALRDLKVQVYSRNTQPLSPT